MAFPVGRSMVTEAETLRLLLSRYRDDRQHLQDNPSAAFVYCLDAHDIGAYINPDKEAAMAGFGFAAELVDHDAFPKALQDLKLKSDQLLRQLLFSDDEVGLLPSHGEEIDEEIAFQQSAALRAKISLVAEAKRQVEALQRNPLAKTFIAQGMSDADSRLAIIRLLSRAAPALMALLKPQPESPTARIGALVNKSGLIGINDFAWEALGFEETEARELRAIRPKRARVDEWRLYFNSREDRRRNSNRANRIDAEAVAGIEALNRHLAEIPSCTIRVLLVTRAMTLLSTDSASQAMADQSALIADFLRHPRLLVLPRRQEANVSTGTIAALTLALDTFAAQLHTVDSVTAEHSARRLFLDAWHNFERARFTGDLHAEINAAPNAENTITDARMKQLIDWFGNESDLDSFLINEMNAAVRDFGHGMYSLARAEEEEPIQAQIEHLSAPRRVRVRPLTGSIDIAMEFRDETLRPLGGLCGDLEALLENLPGHPAERYLGWGLLHACRGRFVLAGIYAKGAIEFGVLLGGSSGESASEEAQLLLTQTRRLGGLDAESQQRREEALGRYHDAARRLGPWRAGADERFSLERAAQVVELLLLVGDLNDDGQQITMGVDALLDVLARNRGNADTGRALSLLLLFVLVSARRERPWPTTLDHPLALADRWHHELIDCIKREGHPEDAPTITRAMHLIGYLIKGHDTSALKPTRPGMFVRAFPEELRDFAPELYDQCCKGQDQISALLAAELHKIVRQIQRHKRWDVIYAPIWANYRHEALCTALLDKVAAEKASLAYRILLSVAGASQAGVDAMHRRAYRHVSRLLESVLERIQEGCEPECDPLILFQVQMDSCYARLLVALVSIQPEEKIKRLRSLLGAYDELAQKYPEAAIPHFRLHLIHELLGTEDPEHREHKLRGADPEREKDKLQAIKHLDMALARADADPFLAVVPHHWIKSTMVRRKGAFVLEDTPRQPGPLDSIDMGSSRMVRYLETLRVAFKWVHSHFDPSVFPESDGFFILEKQRRINNIVYYATLYLAATGDLAGLSADSFGKDELRRYLSLLEPKDWDNFVEISIVHTLGCAYSTLGDAENAARAGEKLMDLVRDSGIDPAADTQLVTLMSDASSWSRRQTAAVLA
jgi:hypothetical protein